MVILGMVYYWVHHIIHICYIIIYLIEQYHIILPKKNIINIYYTTQRIHIIYFIIYTFYILPKTPKTADLKRISNGRGIWHNARGLVSFRGRRRPVGPGVSDWCF
jgi:hypothetical protein